MEDFLVVLIFGVIIVIISYYVNKKKKEKLQEDEKQREISEEIRQNELDSLKEKWEERKKDFSLNGLPTLNQETLHLTKDEVCHFAGEASFCKPKQQIVGYKGGSRGVSLRVMKGMSFRVGNHKGHYIKEDIIEKTNGLIYLTNKKLVFTALKNSSVIKYKDIVNLNVIDNMLQIQTEKKTYLFQIDDSFDFLVILDHYMNKIEE